MKRLLILSGKGGTGKTTTAAAFVKFSQARAFADCDVDAPNLHLVTQAGTTPERTDFYGGDKACVDENKCIGCGACEKHCRFRAIRVEGGVGKVSEFACEGCGVCAYVCPQDAITLRVDVAGRKELYVGEKIFSTATLKMGRGNSGKLVTEVKMALMKHASEAELAIFDGSPGIGCPVMASVGGMDVVLIVAEPSKSGISDLERLVKTTSTMQVRLAVCVNKWDVSPANTDAIEAYCRAQEIAFVGRIPYDAHASKAINEGISVADMDCPARWALEDIYQQVTNLLKL